MKKIPVLVALMLAAAGSWAFYAKAASSVGTQYLILVSDITLDPSPQYNAALTVIEPNGTVHSEELSNNFYSSATRETVAATVSKDEGRAYVDKRSRYARNLLLQKENQKINELSAQGWALVSTAPDKFGIRYIFQKSTL